MAVYLANTFDGGTNGTTITPAISGGTSGPAFDAVVSNTGSTGVLSYDSTHVLGGHPLALKAATGGTSTSVYVSWSASLTASGLLQVFFRQYLYFTANPSGSNVRVFNALTTGAAQCGGINITTAGVVSCVIASGGAATSTVTTIPLNQFFRIEGYLIGDPSVGQLQVKLFTTADASIPAETKTSTATQNTTGTVGICRFGICTALTGAGPFWMASPGASDTGYLGPEAPVSGIPRTFAGPVLLNGPMRAAGPRRIYPMEPSGQRVIPVTLPAVVTTTGTIADQASKVLATSVTTAGTAQDRVSKSLAASVTTTGSVTRQVSRAFTATVTAAAAAARSPAKTFTAAVTATGSLARQAGKTLPAAVTTTSSLGQQAVKTLAAAVTTTASLARNPGKTFSAAITATAALARSPGKTLPATVTTAATLGARSLAKTLTVTVTATGSLGRTLTRTFTATVTTTATYAKGYHRTFTVAVTTAGAIRRGIGKILSAVVNTAGAIIHGSIPGPRQPGVLTITPYGPLTAVPAITPTGAQAATGAITPYGPLAATVTLEPAVAQTATVTITPTGAQAAALTASAPGQPPVTWEPAPPLAAQPSQPVVLTPSA